MPLDNVVSQILTWLDVAIVFGSHIPFLFPFVALSLWANRATIKLGLTRYGLKQTRQNRSKPSMGYLGMSVMVQQAFLAWTFLDSRFLGWQVVLCVNAVVAALTVSILVARSRRIGHVLHYLSQGKLGDKSGGGGESVRGRRHGVGSIVEMTEPLLKPGEAWEQEPGRENADAGGRKDPERG